MAPVIDEGHAWATKWETVYLEQEALTGMAIDALNADGQVAHFNAGPTGGA